MKLRILHLALAFMAVAVWFQSCSGAPSKAAREQYKAPEEDNYDANFSPTLPRPPQPERTALENFVIDGIQYLSDLISKLPARVLDFLPFEGNPEAHDNENSLKKLTADSKTNEFKHHHFKRSTPEDEAEDEAPKDEVSEAGVPLEQKVDPFLRDFTNLRNHLHLLFTPKEETPYQRDQRLNQALMSLVWMTGDQEKLKSPLTQSFLRSYWNPRWKPVNALIDESQVMRTTQLITSKEFTDPIFENQTADLEEPELTKKVLTALFYSVYDNDPVKSNSIRWEVKVFIERILGLEDWLDEFKRATRIGPPPRRFRSKRWISSETDKKVKQFWEDVGTKKVDGIVRQLDHAPRILGKLSPWSGNTNEKVWWRS